MRMSDTGLTIVDHTAGLIYTGHSLESAARTKYGRRAFPRVVGVDALSGLHTVEVCKFLGPIGDTRGYRVLASWTVAGLATYA